MSNTTIDIVGAGPAGLYAALLFRLRHPHLQVRVHEARERLHCEGLGLILYAETLDDLMEQDYRLGDRVMADAISLSSISVKHSNRWTRSSQAGLFGVWRKRLIDALVSRCIETGVEIRWGSTVSSLEDLRGTDLVVIANGARSGLRDAASADLGVTLDECRNQYLWMYVDHAFDGFIFDFQPCGFDAASGVAVLHGYPYARDRSSVIVEIPARDAATFIAINRGQRTRALQWLSDKFSHSLQGHALRFADEVSALSMERFYTVRCSHWVLAASERTPPAVMIGDAAHTAHFSIGSGTRLALADASALATCYPDIEAYQRIRQRKAEHIQHKARLSMEWFAGVADHLHLTSEQFTQSLLGRADSRFVTA